MAILTTEDLPHVAWLVRLLIESMGAFPFTGDDTVSPALWTHGRTHRPKSFNDYDFVEVTIFTPENVK